jgi:hypothetical protein
VLLDKEEGNVEMEGLLHSTGSNDLKIASLPITTAAIMPSPILLWRFKVFAVTCLALHLLFLVLRCLEMLNEVNCFVQVLLFFLWGFICCKVSLVFFDLLISGIYYLLSQDHVL